MRVSDSPEECPLCRPWERRVLSLTGATPGYPTKAEAIAAGLYHANCTHRHYLYIPGVSRDRVPQSNPVGYEQRQDQRKIERDIRRWKRRSAVAGNDSDRAVADRKVRFYQARMRGFIKDTGRLRQRDREQLRLPVTKKINLRSETPQVVAWPRDMRSLYQGKPGQGDAAPLPVVYPVHRMEHITVDNPHRIEWVEANTKVIRDAIERPEIVYSELEFHRKTRHYRQVCASRLVVPNGKHTHVITVLSLGQPGKEDVHDLWTVFTCKDSYLYENSGGVAKLKSKYRRVAP